jgi:Rrf2 family transcriptional regulator, iron-sulfur cluster assembly transcription factor
LRAVLFLAREPDSTLRADEIADATGAPRNYMAKTLNALVKAGILRSARGPQGGFALAVPPSLLTLARVIDCFDEPRRHTRCLLGNGPCDATNPCAAHAQWSRITSSRRAPLDNTSIADLLAGTSSHASSAA